MAGTVNTRDEALTEIHRALGVFAQHGEASIRETRLAVQTAKQHAEQVCRQCEKQVGEIERAMSSLGPEDDPRPLQAALARAKDRLAVARNSLASIAEIENRLAAAARRFLSVATEQTQRARSYLAGRSEQLIAYRQGGGGAGALGGIAVSGASELGGGPSASADGTRSPDPFSARGLTDVALDKVDFRDNPIRDNFQSGGANIVDYRWAGETWQSVVRPGVLAGLTRDDFAAQDAARGARPFRRTADVYDLFLGTDPIRLSPRDDGTYNVIGGRHRVEIARRLGIASLPVTVES